MPPAEPAPVPDDERLAHNQAAWDERAPRHVVSHFYDNESFKAGRSSLRAFEQDEVGDVAGKELVHLQCHFGQDTLSWARLGARVSGLDFSPAAVAAATSLADDLGIEADFRCANVYDAVEAFDHRQFDVLYTGLGALVWLPDLTRWAAVCAELVRPGGVLYLVEMHPITDVFGDEDLHAVGDYFGPAAGTRYDEPGSYALNTTDTEHNTTYEWTHPIAEVVTALLEAGLQLELLHEHDFTVFARWPWLRAHPDHTWTMPADKPRLPLLYSLRARRPG